MAFISGEQRPNFEGDRGTKTIWGTGNIRKQIFDFWEKTSHFISGGQWNRYPAAILFPGNNGTGTPPTHTHHHHRRASSLVIGCEPESRMLPTPKEFCRHILSERTTQAASNKRRLHPVSGGISL